MKFETQTLRECLSACANKRSLSSVHSHVRLQITLQVEASFTYSALVAFTISVDFEMGLQISVGRKRCSTMLTFVRPFARVYSYVTR